MDGYIQGARLLQRVPPARRWAESDCVIVPDESSVPLMCFAQPLEQGSRS